MNEESYAGTAKPRAKRKTKQEKPVPGGLPTLEQRQKEWRREEEEWAARSGPVTVRYAEKSASP